MQYLCIFHIISHKDGHRIFNMHNDFFKFWWFCLLTCTVIVACAVHVEARQVPTRVQECQLGRTQKNPSTLSWPGANCLLATFNGLQTHHAHHWAWVFLGSHVICVNNRPLYACELHMFNIHTYKLNLRQMCIMLVRKQAWVSVCSSFCLCYCPHICLSVHSVCQRKRVVKQL